jgi:hypothetical protein
VATAAAMRWDPENFSHGLRELNDRLHLPYALRDTLRSQLAMKGESLYKISTLIGNSPALCRSHYAVSAAGQLETIAELAIQLPRSRMRCTQR